MELIGWIGAVCFSLCALPQAYVSWTQKHSDGLSGYFLGLWFVGEVLTIVYVWPTMMIPLLANYAANLACLLVILYYKFFPKKIVYISDDSDYRRRID